MIEKASRVHVTLAVGKKAPYTVSIAHFTSVDLVTALAAAAAGHGEADEEAPPATDAAGVTVAEKRLRKKAGDLVMLFFTWLDWDHSTAHVGGSDAGLSGAFADFREDLREALCAFAKGLLFEPNAFAGADAAPAFAAELLHQLRVLAAALYSYLLWRSDTPQIGWHPVAETRQYEKFAAALLDELSAEWAVPSAGDALFIALPLLDTFAEMREREDACSEEVVRAVTSCRSLFVERRDATARRTSSTRTAVVDDAVGEEAVDEPVEEPVEEAAEVAVEAVEAAGGESAVVEEEAPAAGASSTCRGAGSGGSTGAGGGHQCLRRRSRRRPRRHPRRRRRRAPRPRSR